MLPSLEPSSAADPIGFPILSLLIALPLAWALVLPFLRENRTVRVVALAGAGLELVLSLAMLAALRPEVAGMQLVERASWIPSLNVHYLVGIDGIAALFPPLTALLFCGVILASWTSVQSMPRLYFALLLALEGVTMGVFCALDLVLFFDVDYEEIVKRLLGRGRADDNEETIRNRLRVYEDKTAPLKDYYTRKGLLRTVKGTGTIEEISARIRAVLDEIA